MYTVHVSGFMNEKILDYARNFNLAVCDLGVYRTKKKAIKYQ